MSNVSEQTKELCASAAKASSLVSKSLETKTYKQLLLFERANSDTEGNYKWQTIDWDLLQQQKLDLIENYDTTMSQGIVALIESLQDYAVDILGIWEFPKNE